MNEQIEIGWCADRKAAPALAEFFAANVGPEYISHGEIQTGRADKPGSWRPGLSGFIADELGRRLQEQITPAGDFGVVTARAGGELVGLALMSFHVDNSPAYGVIEDLVVGSRQRDRGIGRQILQWIEEDARRRGVSQLFLESGVANRRAHAFFEREGYHTCSVTMMKVLGG
jgi:GNAT superfamily N-acetyltransferase